MPRRGRGRGKRRTVEEDGGSSDDEGVLRIGGVRVQVDGRGNIAGITRSTGRGHGRRGGGNRRAQRDASRATPGSADVEPSEEAESSGAEDYLQNVAVASDAECGSGGSGDSGTPQGRRSAQWQLEMLQRLSGVELGHEGAVENIGWLSEDEDESSDADSESSADSFSSGAAAALDAAEREPMSVAEQPTEPPDASSDRGGPGILTLDDVAALPPDLRYPVAVRPLPPPAPPPPPGLRATAGKKAQRSGIKGAKGGKLAPGEKARLRKEGIEARRASRAASRGFDLSWINKQLQEMVTRDLDMIAFPGMGKHECRQVHRLAALYGCRAGTQGSGKRRTMVVAATTRTALPQADALLHIGRLLAAQNVAELGTAAASMPTLRSSNRGRWAQPPPPPPPPRVARGAPGVAPKRDHVWGSQRGKEGVNRSPQEGKLAKPIAFVSRGAIDPSEGVVEVVLRSRHEASGAAAADECEAEAEPSASPGQLQLLEVYEDLHGDGPSGDDEGAALGLGATRVGPLPASRRGVAAAEGITNPGRLLQLGMALGIGSEVFGAPGPGLSTVDGGAADLSPLQPKPSKKQAQRQRRLSRPHQGGSSVPSAEWQGVAAHALGAADGTTVGSTKPGSKGERKRRPGSNDAARTSAAPEEVAVGGDYGDFERHTTGIGSKLLSKWGFAGAGAGLGRNGEGIAEPVRAQLRAKGLGLGA